MMVFNGVNIFPIEIEQCLKRHTDVDEAVAMPLRHALHQDLPCAVVVLRKDARATQDQLQQFAASALGAKQPRAVVVVDAIPRNPQGKPDKEALSHILSQAISPPEAPDPSAQSNRITFSFIPKDAHAAHRLFLWSRLLDNDVPDAQAPGSDNLTEAGGGRLWLNQVLAFSVDLLQAARIPVFEPIAVLDCSLDATQTDRWHASCILPAPIWTDHSTMKTLLGQAFKLAEWACTADFNQDAHRQQFFQLIARGPLKTLASTRPLGQTTFELLRVAHHMSVPCRPLGGGVIQLGWGSHARRIERSTSDSDSALGMVMTQNKSLTARLLREAGLSAPVLGLAVSLAEARDMARKIGYPVVVKPNGMDHGEGVTADVQEVGIEAAFEIALQKSPRKSVWIERQVLGECHRVFITAGKMLYAVKCLPMGVYGDGSSSLANLVEAECKRQALRAPWLQTGIQPLDTHALEMLARQGLAPENAPLAGQFVALRRIESVAWGGVEEDVSEIIHPDNVAGAIRAARLFGLEVASVEVISQDISQPWHTHGAVFNEINCAPLLGGGDISRRHIPEYLSLILKDKGRIPVHTWVGGQDAWAQARAQWTSLREQGVAAYLTDDKQTLDAQGQCFAMATQDLHSRVQALLWHSDAGALVVVCPTALQERRVRAICH
jgi:D-alanine-D-alanine ligase-like ATP-grasp enzyme